MGLAGLDQGVIFFDDFYGLLWNFDGPQVPVKFRHEGCEGVISVVSVVSEEGCQFSIGTPGTCSTKQDNKFSWITALSKPQTPPELGMGLGLRAGLSGGGCLGLGVGSEWPRSHLSVIPQGSWQQPGSGSISSHGGILESHCFCLPRHMVSPVADGSSHGSMPVPDF